MEVFVVNMLLYVAWLVWSVRNREKCSAFYIFSVLMYAAVAGMGIYIFGDNIYQNEIQDHRSVEYLSYVPYILMFLMMLFVLWPIKELQKFELGWSDVRLRRFSDAFVLMLLAHMFFWLHGFQFGAASDLGDAYHMSVSGDLGLRYGSDVETIIAKILRRFSICITPVFYYLQFYRISKGKNSGIAIVFLCTGFISNVVPPILQGNRGSIFFSFFSLFFIYTCFSSDIPAKLKKVIYSLVLVALGVLLFYVLMISIYRAKGDADVAIGRIFRYFGEPFLNLGLVYWNSTDVHTYGVRFFPKFVEFAGIELPDSKYGVDALREFWTRVYGVNMYYFKTLFGDLYMEFGVVGAFIVAGLVTMSAKLAKKIKNPFVLSLLMYYYARIVILWGIFGFGVLQNACVDIAYAVVFWLLLSKFWNPTVKKEEEAEKNEVLDSNTSI